MLVNCFVLRVTHSYSQLKIPSLLSFHVAALCVATELLLAHVLLCLSRHGFAVWKSWFGVCATACARRLPVQPAVHRARYCSLYCIFCQTCPLQSFSVSQYVPVYFSNSFYMSCRTVILAMNRHMAVALARSECIDESTERPLTFVVIVPHWSDPPAPFLRALIGPHCHAPTAFAGDAGAKAEPSGQVSVVGTSELPTSEKHSSDESASSSIAASIACSSAAANPETLDPYRRRVVLLPAGAHAFVSGSQHAVDRTPRQSASPSSSAPTAASASLFAAAHRSALIVLQNRAAFALRPPTDARVRAVVDAFRSH
jgi:hypothetical protein